MRFLPVLIVSGCLLLANDYDSVKQLIEMIGAPRVGVSDSKLALMKNPFEKPAPKLSGFMYDKNGSVLPVPPERVPQLKAVLEKQALMDDKWVKVGDRIGSFVVVSVEPKSVELKGTDSRKVLKIFADKKIK